MNVQLWEGCPWREISVRCHSLNPLSCGAQGNSGIEQRIFFFSKEIILPISSVDGFYCTGSLRVLLLHYLICFWGSWNILNIIMSSAVCLRLAPLNLLPRQSLRPRASLGPCDRQRWAKPTAVADPLALVPWRTARMLNRLVGYHLNNRFQSFACFQNRARASDDKDGEMAAGRSRDWQPASASEVSCATSRLKSQLLR